MQNSFIKFTGTGSAQASPERFHSSFLFNAEGKIYLIDAGDGISKALTLAKISFNDIEAVFISHMHPDHYAGLAGLLIQMKLIKRTKKLDIYIHESLCITLTQYLNFSYLFFPRFGFSLNIIPVIYDEFFRPGSEFEVLTRHNSHLDDYIKDSPGEISFACSSFLFNFCNKTVFYTGDIGSEEDLYIFNDYNIDIFISEATHISPEQVIKAADSQGAGLLYFTHLSSGDDEKLKKLIINYEGSMKEKIYIAEEGMELIFKELS